MKKIKKNQGRFATLACSILSVRTTQVKFESGSSGQKPDEGQFRTLEDSTHFFRPSAVVVSSSFRPGVVTCQRHNALASSRRAAGAAGAMQTKTKEPLFKHVGLSNVQNHQLLVQ